MTVEHCEVIRSFIILLYDGKLKERGYFQVPVSTAAPFGNRILYEVLPEQMKLMREPWYGFVPYDTHVSRSPLPKGHTSLYGVQYNPEKEPPPRVTLHPEARILCFGVCIFDFQDEKYRGKYSVDDIFLAGAEYLARAWIRKEKMEMNEGPFYYEVDASPHAVSTVSPDLFPTEAYQMEGVFQLPPLAKDRKRIQFRRVAPSPLPERDISSFGNTQTHGRGDPGNGIVLMHERVFQALQKEIQLSARAEEGGFLVGFPYRQPGSPENEDDPEFRWILEITDVVQAESAWGRPLMILFTGDTWSHITRRIDREFPGKRLVSWFHTHLFKAAIDFGLSGMDQDMHRRFFTRPWQTAVLINIDTSSSNREIRCFRQGPEEDLAECTFDVVAGWRDAG